MKGQGQITEPEREILRRAAAGDQNMSREEILAATEIAERLARQRISQGQKNAKTIKSIPSFAPIFPMVDQRLEGVPPGGRPITPATGLPKRAVQGKVTEAPTQTKQRTVARTGKTKDGRTVVEYTDGTREFR
jgi:hypothetical protein